MKCNIYVKIKPGGWDLVNKIKLMGDYWKKSIFSQIK